MSITSLIAFLIVGAIAGWLAGQLMKGGGYGLVTNIVLGVIGSYVGGLIFNLLQLEAGGLIGEIVVATFGAMVLIWVARRLR